MGLNDFILNGMRWSFSSVNSYNTCPQAFKLGYLDALPRVGNAFSDWGTWMHSIMERYFKGELEFFELSQVYVNGYEDNITCEFPPNKFCDLGERYYEAGKAYLDAFNGMFEDYTVLGVEQKVRLSIDGRPFVGVIDLLVQAPDGIWVCDHKSKSRFKSRRECAEYARQLYLYAIYVHEKYGEWPTKLVFHMVRSGGELVEIPFNQNDCDDAKRWFLETIDRIYEDDEFVSTPNRIRRELSELKSSRLGKKIGFEEYRKQKKKLETELKGTSFFCHCLCGSRDVCPLQDQGPEED